MTRKNRTWIVGGAAALLIMSIVFSDSFQNALDYHRSIRKAQNESTRIQEKINSLRKDLKLLKKHPDQVEYFVRRELGYLRPGEKEVRFTSGKK